MLSVVDAEFSLCWVLFMQSVVYAECTLCRVWFMLCVVLRLLLFMQSEVYALFLCECCLC
jgi:hypothetical protein